MNTPIFATSLHVQTMCNIVLCVCTHIVNLYMFMNLQQFTQSAVEYRNLFINRGETKSVVHP